jgi:hypothetical protein
MSSYSRKPSEAQLAEEKLWEDNKRIADALRGRADKLMIENNISVADLARSAVIDRAILGTFLYGGADTGSHAFKPLLDYLDRVAPHNRVDSIGTVLPMESLSQTSN